MCSVAINFVTTEDVKMLREIEQFYNTEISEMVSFAVYPPWLILLVPLLISFPLRFAQPLNVADLI